jgi:diguanylate cyclase (GGDEF)-like protein
VSRPGDFSPSEVLDMRDPDRQPSSDDGVLKMGGLGLVLLLTGWIVLSIPHFGTTQFILETLVLLTIGAYAFIAAARTRRTAVALEKRLRFDLLVRNVELENMAIRDDLTQLFNRRYFFERLERELEAAKGFNRPFSIMVIDLNSMKSVNDNYGQKTGDEVICHFGRFLLDRTRASDVTARIDGDEFAMILADTDESAASVAAQRLLEALQNVELIDDRETPSISASVGLAGYPWSGDTVDGIVRAAGEALDADRSPAEADRRSDHATDSSVPVAERERPVAAE